VINRILSLNERLVGSLRIVEQLLVSVVALLLLGFAALGLFNTLALVKDALAGGGDYAVIIADGIDAAFLTIILLELLHTVLSRGSIVQQVQEFLVIGITSAVRHGLTVTASGNRATAGGALQGAGSSARDVGINLTINAGGVLVLVAALWLVRQATVSKTTMQRDDRQPSRETATDEAL